MFSSVRPSCDSRLIKFFGINFTKLNCNKYKYFNTNRSDIVENVKITTNRRLEYFELKIICKVATTTTETSYEERVSMWNTNVDNETQVKKSV